MRKIPSEIIFVAALLSLSIMAGTSRAEITIDELVRQANIVEGAAAVRELPRWNGARKILLRDIGIDFGGDVEMPDGVEIVKVRSLDEALQHAADIDAIIGFCNAELVDAAIKLVWVQIYWAGAESCLAVDRVGSGDVVMTNMQKMSSPVIAEHAITMAMSLSRNIPQLVNAMDDHDWQASAAATEGMTSIAGRNLLVVGLGGIGTEVARLGAALGMHVTGTRNSSRSGPEYMKYVGLSHELNDLAAKADVIVNALPLTDSTRGLLDAEFFSAVKPGALFVNVGRGETVVTSDLVTALESGQIAGAGLDVTDPEPLPSDSVLWRRDDVIITPHSAGRGGERERHALLLRENIRRYVNGDKLLNVVDPDKGY